MAPPPPGVIDGGQSDERPGDMDPRVEHRHADARGQRSRVGGRERVPVTRAISQADERHDADDAQLRERVGGAVAIVERHELAESCETAQRIERRAETVRLKQPADLRVVRRDGDDDDQSEQRQERDADVQQVVSKRTE